MVFMKLRISPFPSVRGGFAKYGGVFDINSSFSFLGLIQSLAVSLLKPPTCCDSLFSPTLCDFCYGYVGLVCGNGIEVQGGEYFSPLKVKGKREKTGKYHARPRSDTNRNKTS